MNKYQSLVWENPNTHEWYEEGKLERWVDKEKCVNLLPKHRGAWRVRFHSNNKVVYMSNGEVVAARKRVKPEDLSEVNPNLNRERQAQRKKIVRKFKSQEKKRKRYGRKINYTDKFIASVVVVLYLLYPTLTRATFKLVACQTVGKNRYLQMELDLLCWNELHNAWVGLLFFPALIAYVIGLPLLAFVRLRKFRNHLYDKIPRFHYGTLYLGFKHQFYFWEVITACRKTSIIMISVFLTASKCLCRVVTQRLERASHLIPLPTPLLFSAFSLLSLCFLSALSQVAPKCKR